eukprot:3039220-Pyramimonas_sp.AAC.1
MHAVADRKVNHGRLLAAKCVKHPVENANTKTQVVRKFGQHCGGQLIWIAHQDQGTAAIDQIYHGHERVEL